MQTGHVTCVSSMFPGYWRWPNDLTTVAWKEVVQSTSNADLTEVSRMRGKAPSW